MLTYNDTDREMWLDMLYRFGFNGASIGINHRYNFKVSEPDSDGTFTKTHSLSFHDQAEYFSIERILTSKFNDDSMISTFVSEKWNITTTSHEFYDAIMTLIAIAK